MSENNKIEIQDNVISLIKEGKIRMHSRWYFLLASLAITIGLVSLVLILVFLISLISFSLRSHGPMGAVRYQQLISSFPWWAPLLTILGFWLGIKIFRSYDFSYKKNFLLIIAIFITTISVVGWLINYLGFDKTWFRKGSLNGVYNHYDGGRHNGSGWRKNQR